MRRYFGSVSGQGGVRYCILRLIITGTKAVAYTEILFGGGVSTNSVGDKGQRDQRSGGSSPLVRGSGGSCNLVQEILFLFL